ncbi:MAG: type II toxin-antitoxin system RelE/ParE family toxin [Planctomycetales bacterium]
MAATVIWTLAALDDVQKAAEYISRDSKNYAAAFIQQVWTAESSVGEFPEAGAIVPEFDSARIREVFVHRYRLIYEHDGDRAFLLACIHGARDLRAALKGRLSDLGSN